MSVKNNEQKYLKKCLSLIEEKLDLAGRKSWSGNNYRQLSEDIKELSDIYVSEEDIRGIVKSEKTNLPEDSKHAISLYLGYDGWEDFKLRIKKKNPISYKDNWIVLLIITIVLSSLIALVVFAPVRFI
jgi:hypothetical protein